VTPDAAAVLPGQLGPPVDLRDRFGPAREAFVALLRSLTPGDWSRPTVCPGWDVTAVVAHVVGDDLARLARGRDGAPARRPARGESLPTFLDRINGEWVALTHHYGPRVLTDLLAWTGAQVAAYWSGVAPDDECDGVSWAGVGTSPTMWLDLARDRTEYWVHEQQVREAVGRPDAGPADEVAATTAEVLDVFARGLPFALRAVPAPPGAVATVTATDLGRTWAVTRRDDRWWVTGEPADGGPAFAAATAPSSWWWRRWTRHPAAHRGDVSLTGDPSAAAALADHLAIIRPPD
jgi:uncharacterized protein (TIGR03083 family)